MEKRELIKEDLKLADYIANQLPEFKTVLGELEAAYRALDLGILTNEKFKELILLGSEKTICLYKESLNKQLDSIGITSKIMRDKSISLHDELIKNLNDAIDDAKSFKPHPYSSSQNLSLRFISFEDRFMVSQDDYEAILETYCRTYIDPINIEHLEMARELEVAYNKFLNLVDKQNITTANRLHLLELIFKTDENRKAVIDPLKLSGLVTYAERRALHFERGTR